jgi:MscS family membrane protein
LLGFVLARLFSRPSSPLYPRVKRFFILPFALLVVGRVIDYVISDLGVGITAQKIVQAQTLNTVVLAWAMVALSGLLRDYYANRLLAEGREGAVVLLRPGIQALQIIIVLVVLLVWLTNIGFNITTILAGLGVGGIAVALALQKPMEDIFGALSLYTQQPIKIGDFCRIGGDTGTVEEIGLRMTRIRTLANTLISIPNATLATQSIDNFSARNRIRYNPTLRLRVDVSPGQIESILQKLRQMLAEHEKVDQKDARVRFQNISEDALEIVIVAHVQETRFADYLIVAEDLNLRIMAILDSEGVTLAVPARSVKIDPQGSLA